MHEAQRRLRELNSHWRDLLTELDLPPSLTPEHAREALADRAMHARPSLETNEAQLELQATAVRNELELRREWLTTLGGKLRQLLKDLSLPSGGTLIEQYETLREAYADYQERRQSRRQIARALKRLRQKAHQLQATGRRYINQRKQLTHDLATKQAKHELQQHLRQDRRKLLEQQRELVELDIEELRERHGVESKTPLAEFSDEELEARLSALHDKLTSLRDKRLRQMEKRGRLRAQLSMLGDQQEENGLVRWQDILSKTSQLRDQLIAVQKETPTHRTQAASVRSEYLDYASDFLSQLSGGQFVGIDLNSDDTLEVTDSQNVTSFVQDIHPNHYPNVYFSFWLARVQAYADQGIRLPVVMEDPLEATKESRRPAVAQMLAEFAGKGHQLILVTSDPDNAHTFARLGVPIADFSQREPQPQVVEHEYRHQALPRPVDEQRPVEVHSD